MTRQFFFGIAPTGKFNRAGVHFTRDRRPFELGDADDPTAPIPVVSPESFQRIQAETESRPLTPTEREYFVRRGDEIPARTVPMLIVFPATADEVASWQKDSKS